MKKFTTEKREEQIIEFEIDDEMYTFTTPKRASLATSVLTTVGLHRPLTDSESLRDLLNWFSEGLGEEQNARLMARLEDPEDDFDLPDVTRIARWLITETSGRPTKRR
jgi:hypothetical protein